MEDMIEKMIAKTGIDRATCEKVVGFLKDHAADVPGWIASNDTAKAVVAKVPGLGGLLG